MTQTHLRFICDAMLGHIGRRLRSAGYDTAIDKGQISDLDLLEIASVEDRILLTCDRGILEQESRARIIYLALNDELSWAAKLTQDAGVNWTLAPMTRCLDCNTPLVTADEIHRSRMPESIRKYGRPGLVCKTCDKVYWEGTHTERMRARLEAMNQATR